MSGSSLRSGKSVSQRARPFYFRPKRRRNRNLPSHAVAVSSQSSCSRASGQPNRCSGGRVLPPGLIQLVLLRPMDQTRTLSAPWHRRRSLPGKLRRAWNSCDSLLAGLQCSALCQRVSCRLATGPAVLGSEDTSRLVPGSLSEDEGHERLRPATDHRRAMEHREGDHRAFEKSQDWNRL